MCGGLGVVYAWDGGVWYIVGCSCSSVHVCRDQRWMSDVLL